MDDSTATLSASDAKKRSLWFHLHFWVGWIAAIPIALVCLTGALLVFEHDIFVWENKELFQLEATGDPLSIQQILDAYASADPPLKVNHLGIPKSPTDSYGAYCTEIRPEGNRGARVFLNPYTGELTRLGDGFSLSKLFVDVHRRLAAGRTGQQVGASARWPWRLPASLDSFSGGLCGGAPLCGLGNGVRPWTGTMPLGWWQWRRSSLWRSQASCLRGDEPFGRSWTSCKAIPRKRLPLR